MFPKVIIDRHKYKDNVKYLQSLLAPQGIMLAAVSKVYCADQYLIECLNELEVDMIGDSRIENLKKMHTSRPKMLLRIPMMTEVDDVVKYTDISLNSELKTIMALNEAAKSEHKIHDIILMFDLGDLREGIYHRSDFTKIIEDIKKLKHIHLKGIGTNLTCYGGVIPTLETYEKLETVIEQVESSLGKKLEIISGGNSSSLEMLMNGELPSYINHLRIGETLVLGRETAYGKQIEHMHDDVFVVEAEIIELQEKPSHPEGILGMDAFGQHVKFFDKGMMTRAILALGRQDVNCEDLIPMKDIEVVGCSSDHLIVEIKEGAYQVGDSLKFKLTYGGILRVMTSPYVVKTYV